MQFVRSHASHKFCNYIFIEEMTIGIPQWLTFNKLKSSEKQLILNYMCN